MGCEQEGEGTEIWKNKRYAALWSVADRKTDQGFPQTHSLRQKSENGLRGVGTFSALSRWICALIKLREL